MFDWIFEREEIRSADGQDMLYTYMKLSHIS